MIWSELYGQANQPGWDEIRSFTRNTLWDKLTSDLENLYEIKPKITYSKCSALKGWNVKYQKSSKSLCTLYPMDGFFLALVVIGRKEQAETELYLSSCTSYIRELYEKTTFSCGGRWLVIHVTSGDILRDTEGLIMIRSSAKRQK